MTWRDWMPALFKSSSVNRAVLLQTTPGVAVWTPRNYETLAKEGYGSSAIVYACINEIAKAIGGLQWLVQQRRGGQWRELEAHPLLDLLARPNPMQGGGRFFETLTGYLMISGNSYIERVGPGTGAGRFARAPRELYALRPDRMTVVPGDTANIVAGYEYRAGGAVVELPAPLVLHEKLFAPVEDWYGLSPLQVLARTVDTDNTAINWNYSLLKKGARPSGALVTQKSLRDDQYTRLRAQIDQDFAGADRAGYPMLLEGGLDWKEMSLSPKDMDWLESRRMSKQDVAMGYGVPAELIGLKEATYENRREAKRAFYTETVLPLADFLTGDLNNWLVPLYGERVRLAYDRDAIEALQEDREKVWARVQKADWLTVNEKRAATGYDERPDGDVLLVPFSLTPLAQVGDTGTDFAQLPTDGAPKGLAIKAATRDAVREREWTARVRQFLPIEQRYQKALASYFNAQRDEVLRRLDRASIGHTQRTAAGPAQSKAVEEILFELDEQTGKLREVSRPYFDEAVARGGEAVWAEVGASGSFSPAAPETRIQIDYQLRQLSGVTERVRQRIEQEIAAGLSADESPAEIAARINRLYAGTAGAKAATIARTEVARAYNETRWTAMRQLGIETAEWLTARDEAVREAHAIDGEVQRLGVPFSNGLRFPHDPTGAAGNVINCFVPDTRVRGSFVAGSKARYAGPVRRIKTARGYCLTVTPGHPILTTHGWMSAGELQKGMAVLSGQGGIEATLTGAIQDQNVPSAIEDVFEALAIHGAVRSARASLSDLHGDAIWTDGQIDVVGADSDPLRHAVSALPEQPRDLVVVAPTFEQLGVERLSSCQLAIKRVNLSASALPGRRTLPLHCDAVSLHLQPLQPFRVGTSTELDATLNELTVQRSAGHAELLGETLERFASLIAADEIVEIREDEFVGHVFDLQSTNGIMVAENIITSNCRCVAIPVARS